MVFHFNEMHCNLGRVPLDILITHVIKAMCFSKQYALKHVYAWIVCHPTISTTGQETPKTEKQ